jgi:hypothetical protein
LFATVITSNPASRRSATLPGSLRMKDPIVPAGSRAAGQHRFEIRPCAGPRARAQSHSVAEDDARIAPIDPRSATSPIATSVARECASHGQLGRRALPRCAVQRRALERPPQPPGRGVASGRSIGEGGVTRRV